MYFWLFHLISWRVVDWLLTNVNALICRALMFIFICIRILFIEYLRRKLTRSLRPARWTEPRWCAMPVWPAGEGWGTGLLDSNYQINNINMCEEHVLKHSTVAVTSQRLSAAEHSKECLIRSFHTNQPVVNLTGRERVFFRLVHFCNKNDKRVRIG